MRRFIVLVSTVCGLLGVSLIAAALNYRIEVHPVLIGVLQAMVIANLLVRQFPPAVGLGLGLLIAVVQWPDLSNYALKNGYIYFGRSTTYAIDAAFLAVALMVMVLGYRRPMRWTKVRGLLLVCIMANLTIIALSLGGFTEYLGHAVTVGLIAIRLGIAFLAAYCVGARISQEPLPQLINRGVNIACGVIPLALIMGLTLAALLFYVRLFPGQWETTSRQTVTLNGRVIQMMPETDTNKEIWLKRSLKLGGARAVEVEVLVEYPEEKRGSVWVGVLGDDNKWQWVHTGKEAEVWEKVSIDLSKITRKTTTLAVVLVTKEGPVRALVEPKVTIIKEP